MRDGDEDDGDRETDEDTHDAGEESDAGAAGDATPDRDDDEFPSLDELIGTFFSEPSLLPVVIVVLGSGGAFGASSERGAGGPSRSRCRTSRIGSRLG